MLWEQQWRWESRSLLPLARFAIFVFDLQKCGAHVNAAMCMFHLTFWSYYQLLARSILVCLNRWVVLYFLQTRPAALAALETVGLTGKGGVLSHTSPGVFLQVKNRVMWSIYVYPSWNLTDHIVWPNWCSKHSCKLNVNLEWYSCVAVSWMARHCNPYKRMWFFSHKKPWLMIHGGVELFVICAIT